MLSSRGSTLSAAFAATKAATISAISTATAVASASSRTSSASHTHSSSSSVAASSVQSRAATSVAPAATHHQAVGSPRLNGLRKSRSRSFSHLALPSLAEPVVTPKHLPESRPAEDSRVTGSGVLVVEDINYAAKPSVILFHNTERGCYEEPGGFVEETYGHSAADSARSSAARELFEESCTSIDHHNTRFLPMAIDVRGRSSATRYRSFIARVRGFSEFDYQSKRRQMHQAADVDHAFQETDDVARIPIENLSAAFENGMASPESTLDVKDVKGRTVSIGQRTVKILAAGGLDLLRRAV